MSGWTYNGRHFAETHTERGGSRYFIDGKPTAKTVWLAEIAAAKAAHPEFDDAENMPLLPEGASFHDAMRKVRAAMPDETLTVCRNVAMALLKRSREAAR